jgi:hypothetical protein
MLLWGVLVLLLPPLLLLHPAAHLLASCSYVNRINLPLTYSVLMQEIMANVKRARGQQAEKQASQDITPQPG